MRSLAYRKRAPRHALFHNRVLGKAQEDRNCTKQGLSQPSWKRYDSTQLHLSHSQHRSSPSDGDLLVVGAPAAAPSFLPKLVLGVRIVVTCHVMSFRFGPVLSREHVKLGACAQNVISPSPRRVIGEMPPRSQKSFLIFWQKASNQLFFLGAPAVLD